MFEFQMPLYANKFVTEFKRLVVHKFKFTKEQQIDFLQTLERLTRHLSLPAAIKQMRSTSVGVHVEILVEMQNYSRMGRNPMDALKNWFPQEIASALAIADHTGINDGLVSALEILRSPAANLFGPFLWLLYPMLGLGIALGTSRFVSTAILADFRSLIEGSEDYPPEFSSVLAASDFVGFPLVATLLIIVVFLVVMLGVLRGYVNDHRMQLDAYPVFNLYRSISSILFLRMYANLLKMRTPNIKALEIISGVTESKYLQYHISEMRTILKAGKSINRAFETGLIDSRDISTIKALSNARGTGLQEAIVGAHDIAIHRLVKSLKQVSRFIGIPLAMSVLYLFMNVVSVLLGLDILFETQM